MPTLDWIGKSKVVNHHLDVPYCVLDRKYSYDENGQHEDDNGSENMIIHGDNLLALKSLLPQYEGLIKCIYIDPPYNTGNENWVYNDNVNDPRIKKWLGEVVGKEGEDLSRHDKWLCMMYPRLKLLQRLLAEDGAIFISIDDNELYNLKAICDEIFGKSNYLSLITRPTGTHTGVVNRAIVGEADYILVYTKSLDKMSLDGLPLEEKDTKIYDMEDEKGKFLIRPLRRTGGENRREDRPNMYFPIEAPDGTMVYPIGPTGYESRWICNPDGYEYFCNEGRIFWKQIKEGKKVKWQVYQKFYLQDKKKAVSNVWGQVEGNKKATRDVRDIFHDSGYDFDFPKPIGLIERIIKMNEDSSAIFLDSFAGSGTTAHAVLNMNKKDGGNRKFIMIEMMDYADTITAERVKRVINGYGEGEKAVSGTGGNFSYYELGAPIFKDDALNEEVGSDEIRKYVYFTETKQKLEPSRSDEPHYMGTYLGTAYYFNYEINKITTLNREFLHTVKTKAENYVIYADLCTLSQRELEKWHITFKKIPRD
ncbi:MAG: site-specific DNA-methyltransferase, partial [Lachnospiraceae bacterium]|nr:site-specific DNA-methyltransferase [Lachnospiraceae bacterium]